MFTVSGIIFYNTLSDNRDAKILGLPDRWFWAIGYTVFCLFIECLLNLGGLLVWEYPYWNLSFKGIWLILLIGYFHFYVAIILVLALKSIKNKIIAVSSIYAVTITANIITFGFLGWFY